MAQAEKTTARYAAVIVVIAPAVLAAGLAYHPHIPVLFEEGAVAAAVASDATRWGIAHLTVGVGSGLLLLSFLAIRRYLSAAGEDRFSARGLPFIAMGSVLFAVLPGMEFVPLAAAESGGDVQVAQAALQRWFVPTFVTGSVIFAIGIYLFGKAIVRSGVLARGSTWLVVGGLAVVAVARFVPLGTVQFYVQGAAGIVALWPLAYTMWTESDPPPGGSAANRLAEAVFGVAAVAINAGPEDER